MPVLLTDHDFREFATRIRQIVLEQSKRANVGHIGSALSIADVMAALYVGVLDPSPASHDDRDRFILSKGHASMALYASLFLAGHIGDGDLNTYCADGTRLGVHPERGLPGVDFSTGSLGHGLPIATGAALAGSMLGSRRRVFALISDAECNAGSVWEAAMFAGHHRLANLVAIVDMNGQQALGFTRDVLDQSQMDERWRAFGWDVHDLDGHDPRGLADAINGLAGDRPHVVLARTTFGKGVSFMEGSIRWHYMPMSDDEYADATAQVRAGS